MVIKRHNGKLVSKIDFVQKFNLWGFSKEKIYVLKKLIFIPMLNLKEQFNVLLGFRFSFNYDVTSTSELV